MDLLSIAPLNEVVPIRGELKVNVTGVQIGDIVNLLARFPELRKMWAKGEFQPQQMVKMSEDIVVSLIAAGAENLDEANAKHLSLGERVEIIRAILKVTMPSGPGPFVSTLTEIMGAFGGEEVSVKALASKSRKPS